MFDVDHPGTTNSDEPWVLVRLGGHGMPSSRERTRVAYVTQHVTGKLGVVNAYRMTGRLANPTKHAYEIEEAKIVHRWRQRPTPEDVEAVRKRMPVVP